MIELAGMLIASIIRNLLGSGYGDTLMTIMTMEERRTWMEKQKGEQAVTNDQDTSNE